jgi:uncharacterized protein (TIGR03435 family)
MMIRSILATGVALSISSAVFGQAAATAPAFEVASIKPADPQPMGMIRIGMGGDAGRINYTNVSLKEVLTRAYGVKRHQISGPSWLDSERFDINAKIPEGVTTAQVPAMLQTLLAERFKMTIRKETKEQPVYELVVGKNGHKVPKAAEGEAGDPRSAAAPPPPPPPGARVDGGSGGEARGGRSGGAMGGRPPAGSMMVQNDGGTARLRASKATFARFCDMLSNMLDRPVVDMTDDKGEYDFSIEMSADEMRGMRMAMGGRGAPGHGPDGVAGGQSPAPEAAPGASIFSAVQQLGLKLEPRKAPIEFIVIDKAEKVPTEN